MQNVALTLPDGKPGNLVDLLKGGCAFLGIWVGACKVRADEAIRFANAQAPVLRTVQAILGDTPLKKADQLGLSRIIDENQCLMRLLGAQAGDFVLIRPDGYLAAQLPNATIHEARAVLRRALGY